MSHSSRGNVLFTVVVVVAALAVAGWYYLSLGPKTTPPPEDPTLAGTAAPFLIFNQADYDEAVQANKLIVLYFYANWCPICREELPEAKAAFNELTSHQVVGFRVNYKDSDTDATEVALAKKFGVGYQHTKVLVRGGQLLLKNGETWDRERYLTEINRALTP